MAEFPPGGEFRRFRRLLALTVPVARGLSPFLFHRCLPPKGSRGAAVTPDQQAVYSEYRVYYKGTEGVKSTPARLFSTVVAGERTERCQWQMQRGERVAAVKISAA